MCRIKMSRKMASIVWICLKYKFCFLFALLLPCLCGCCCARHRIINDALFPTSCPLQIENFTPFWWVDGGMSTYPDRLFACFFVCLFDYIVCLFFFTLSSLSMFSLLLPFIRFLLWIFFFSVFGHRMYHLAVCAYKKEKIK